MAIMPAQEDCSMKNKNKTKATICSGRWEFTPSLTGFKSNTQQTVKGRRAPAPVVKQRDVF